VKKVVSLALIALLLMNTMGYYAIFMGLQYKNNVAMNERLDADQYDESQAIRLEIPMNVPYLTDDTDFSRVDGVFEYKGESYRMVKQKYAKDILTLIVIKDTENKRIADAMSDYVMSFTDTGDDEGNATLTISFIKDYIPQTFSIQTTSFGWSTDVLANVDTNNLIPTFTVSVIHPPERL
jgi:hypothetical protein